MNKVTKKKLRIFKLPLLLLGIIIISLMLTNKGNESATKQNITNPTISPSDENQIEANDEIQDLIKTSVDNFSGQWGIYIIDLNSLTEYKFNSDKTFATASIYKLAVMYKTYDEIEKGNLKKTDNLIGDKAALEKRISGEGESNGEVEEDFKPKSDDPDQNVSFNVETALFEMITISDNHSALLLADRLGWKNIDNFLKDNNIPNFNLSGKNSPNTTAHDVGILLEKIYSNKAVNAEYSQEMLKLLLQQKINDRIPKYLRANVKVAHKTGELERIRNDAGIVYGKNSNYIFVFLTNTSEPEETAENIALLSKKLFDVLEREYILK